MENVDYRDVLSKQEIELILLRCKELQYDDDTIALILQQAAEDMVRFCFWKLFYTGEAKFNLKDSRLEFVTPVGEKTAQLINSCKDDYANLE